MKSVVVMACVVASVLAQGRYDSSLDKDFQISDVLNNDRLLLSYTKCLLDKGPCTPEVRQVKEKLPEALATRCAKCTDRQKELGKKLAVELKKSHPDIFKQLSAKYDPAGKYQDQFLGSA